MIHRFGEGYIAYRNRTSMFLPRPLERIVMKGGASAIVVVLCVLIVGGGFLLRTYTIRSLPLQRFDGVDVLSISAEDTSTAASLLPAVLADSVVASKCNSLPGTNHHRVLAYFIPVDYVMQGMIANTGDEWKLFEQHRTFGMITEYILHPFAHLTGGHAHHMDMANMKHGPAMYALAAMKRRVIFVEISSDTDEFTSPIDDFSINAIRTPLFFVDVHLHTAEILQMRDTPGGSGWGTVPTPVF